MISNLLYRLDRFQFFCHCLAVILVFTCNSSTLIAQGSALDYERSARWWQTVQNKVYPAELRATWIGATSRFWYRSEPSPERVDYVIVDAATGAETEAFDRQKLAEELGKKVSQTLVVDNLRLEELRFDEQSNSWQFNYAGKGFQWNTKDQTIADREVVQGNNQRRRNGGRWRQRSTPAAANRSPNGKWEVQVENHNLYLVNLADQSRQPLTQDGNEKHYYEGEIYWSPDSLKVLGIKTVAAEPHIIHIVESSPKDQLQPKLRTLDYHKPGDHIAIRKPCLFSIEPIKQITIADTQFPNPWSIEDFRWQSDSSRFTFLYNQRGHQVVRIIAVSAETGEVGVVIDESSSTFVDYAHKLFRYYLDATHEIIWMSERSGWNHLYLCSERNGEVLHQITKGSWVVRGIDHVDSEKRQIWFSASGIYAEQDPYYIHHCRVDFDGGNLIVLTSGNGTHEVDLSPDRTFFIDSYSRVDMAPVVELRSGVDGKLIRVLQTGSMEGLLATGWQIPERFSAKGRDGETDIYGVIYRPSNFDASKSYPILESIYAGPHGSHVPKKFAVFRREQEMAELGFIVVQIDGMGTSNRSKAFHDVCWKNLGDSGFPDRILWIKAAASKYPYMDLNRIGLYGGSAGGQSALRGLLVHGDFYQVAVADCGCHDNRMDKIWWNELWMGYPIDNHYSEQSNVTLAHQLKGKLMLVVGELDDNVDPASTMQVVNALVKADKDFDLLILPGVGHGAAETPYGHRRRKDFLVRHLLGVEPRHP
ncbi:MAG: Dipeptidyl aminopeptidase 4 [Planctomycetota bacterium]|jgi:dipeptidyl aminopeptidase/acylaminoacyl peptidase